MASMTLDRVDRTSQKSETAVQKVGNSRFKTHSARRIYQIDMGIPRSNEALFFVDERSITPIHVVPIRLEPTGRRSCKRIHLHADIRLRTGLTERPVGPNLCIGTTAPTAKLEVAGIAGTDGIKFPDGTTQTIAYSNSNSEVIVVTHAGFGSSYTQVPRFTTILANTGSDLTYTDSATAGASVTINKTGRYFVSLLAGEVYNGSGQVRCGVQ